MQHFTFAGGLLEKLPSIERGVGALVFLCNSCCIGSGQLAGTQQGSSNEMKRQNSSLGFMDSGGQQPPMGTLRGGLNTKPDAFCFSAPDSSCLYTCTHATWRPFCWGRGCRHI